MKNFLIHINKILNNRQAKLSFNAIFLELYNGNYNDKFAKILDKYSSYVFSNKIIKVSEEEGNIILEHYSEVNHILVNLIIDYLLANSPLRRKSRLVEDCISFITLFFDNSYDIEKHLYHTDDLCLVIKWTIYKFPDSKHEISKHIFTKLKKYNNLKSLSLINSFLVKSEKFEPVFRRPV